MADESLSIVLQGVPALSKITIRSHLQNGNHRFFGYGHYYSDIDGQIDLSKCECINGTYAGIDPMGLFWSMKPANGQRKGLRYLPNIFKAAEIKLSAFSDHIETFDDTSPMVEQMIKRKFISDNVTYMRMRHGRLRGILFIPKTDGKSPAIIDIYGSGGGLMPHRAALLASKGFVTLSLAFYRYEDLPKMMDVIDLEYFMEAIDYLKQLEFVQPDAIGAIGLSKGADIMLQVAALSSDIKAVAFVNGVSFPSICDFRWKKGYRKGRKTDFTKVIENDDGSLILRDCNSEDDLTVEEVFPIEQVQGKILIFASGDDLNVNASVHGRWLMERLKQYGSTENCALIEYEGAGHILDPVFMPHVSQMYMKSVGGYMSSAGGIPNKHHLAQKRFWKTLIEFFKSNLSSDNHSLRHKL